MTKEDMYDALVHAYGYKRDSWYPSTRYDEKYRESRETYAWGNAINEYARKDNNMNFNCNDIKLLIDGKIYNANAGVTVTENYGEFPLIKASAYLSSSNKPTATTLKNPAIENVIFNPPATIVFWSDHTKTIVKADYDYEPYDPEKGLAMAIAKKLMGDNKGHYYELFKHWREKWDKQNEATEDIKIDIPKSPVEKFAESVRSTLIIDDLLP